MGKVTQETLAEIEQDYARWSEFLNSTIGIFSFTLGISCLGTSRPDVTAFLSLVFLLLVAYRGRKIFPQKVLELRKADLAGLDEVAYLGIEKKYFGIKAMFTGCAVYAVGWFFLGGVAIYGTAVHAGWI